MKRRRRATQSTGPRKKQATGHDKQHDEAIAAQYRTMLRAAMGGNPAVFFCPANLSSCKTYTGGNVRMLQFATLEHHSRIPLFATFNQIKALGGSVRAGEKAAGHVKHFFLKPPENGRQWGEPVTSWYPVFHMNQLDLPLGVAITVERSLLNYAMPTWLRALNRVYDDRRALHPDNVMALEHSAVPSLMQLASKAVLMHPTAFTSAELRDKVSQDLLPFLWPAAGMDSVETYVTKQTPAWDVAAHDLEAPRTTFDSPAQYYNHLFLWIERRRAHTNPWLPILRAMDHCTATSVPFALSKLDEQRELVLDFSIQLKTAVDSFHAALGVK